VRHFNEAAFFKDAIGITVPPDEKPVRVVLSFTPDMGKYVKTQPLHHSQEIIKEDDKALRIALYLIVNPELIQLLLKYGAAVQVLQPRELKERMKAEAQEIVRLYH